MTKDERSLAIARHEAARLTTRYGIATALVIGEAIYLCRELAIFRRAAEERAALLSRCGAETRRALGAR
jgi:hypothetical protein